MTVNEYYDETSTKTGTKAEHDASVASESREPEFLALQRKAVRKIDFIVSTFAYLRVSGIVLRANSLGYSYLDHVL